MPPVVIIGSGAAGMATALALAPLPVLLVSKGHHLLSGSTPWAQGGLAAALAPEDSPTKHIQDTLHAGCKINDQQRVHILATEGVDLIQQALQEGLPVDRTGDGRISFSREAAHSEARILKIGGDYSGRGLAQWLAHRVQTAPHITLSLETMAADLQIMDASLSGVLLYSDQSGWHSVPASAVVLATGGCGYLWPNTTNPSDNTGDGLVLAARAGASFVDMEFIQFHPTALAMPAHMSSPGTKTPLPLLTEALRGAGARLVDQNGHRFIDEMAPRDVVARAVGHRVTRGQPVFLDLRPVMTHTPYAFPQALATCEAAGLDPSVDLIPVIPAAHYTMGGVRVDSLGRTGRPGLWAVGEVACTGVHGANRLASNSLTEALVFSQRVAKDIKTVYPSITSRTTCASLILPALPDPSLQDDLRTLVGKNLGILRDNKGLKEMAAFLTQVPSESRSTSCPRSALETRSLLYAARLVCAASLARCESRGAHQRLDHPNTDPLQARSVSRTMIEADTLLSEAIQSPSSSSKRSSQHACSS